MRLAARAAARRAKPSAIIAVDPTSRVTGGAILGDRIRMQQHHADPGVFIRSMATRGIARRTRARHRRAGAAARRRRAASRARRNRRRGPGRSRDRPAGGGDGGGAGARHGRRCPGDQGRHHGNRRRVRRSTRPTSPARRPRRSRNCHADAADDAPRSSAPWRPKGTGIEELLARDRTTCSADSRDLRPRCQRRDHRSSGNRGALARRSARSSTKPARPARQRIAKPSRTKR